MAHGYPDFWGSVTIGQPVYGEGQTNVFETESGDIPATSEAELASYEVPAGYEFHFMAGILSCDHPGITKFSMTLMGVPFAPGQFDFLMKFPLHPAAAYVIPSLYTIAINLLNEDTIAHNYTASIFGFLLRNA